MIRRVRVSPGFLKTDLTSSDREWSLRAAIGPLSQIGEVSALLCALADHIESEADAGAAGPFLYGYWSVEAREDDTGELEVWEPKPHDPSQRQRGADVAAGYAVMQRLTCLRHSREYDPARSAGLAVVHPDVMGGSEIEGVRYPPDSVSSGWFFWPPGFDGPVVDLPVEHLWHLTSARPEVADMLALPPGNWFNTMTMSVGFDSWILGERTPPG